MPPECSFARLLGPDYSLSFYGSFPFLTVEYWINFDDGSSEVSVALGVVIILVTHFGMLYRQYRSPISCEPSVTRDLYRHAHMNRIQNRSSSCCINYLRIRKGTFFRLAQIMRNSYLLKDTIHVSVWPCFSTSLVTSIRIG